MKCPKCDENYPEGIKVYTVVLEVNYPGMLAIERRHIISLCSKCYHAEGKIIKDGKIIENYEELDEKIGRFVLGNNGK